MRTLAHRVAEAGPDTFRSQWNAIRRAGIPHVALDAQAPGFRYLSLNALVLSPEEAARLVHLTTSFGRLLDHATDRLLEDRDAWSELAWPWPALELARQEPRHPGGLATLYGRFDWLLDADGQWQLVEYNGDTPSGGREVAGFEPTSLQICRTYEPGLQPLYQGLPSLLTGALLGRLAAYRSTRGVRTRRVGIVSSHSWLEDMAQAAWLEHLLDAAGQPAIVGDMTDLEWRTGDIRLRGERIDALYRFYPIERLYRHALFAPLLEAAIEGRLLLLNGLRGFLAQSKATLAWLWLHRCSPELGADARELIERHLPASLPARHAEAAALLPQAVVKHVNGREGDSVVFGDALDAAGWEARLIEPGYVVQRRVAPVAVEDVVLDDREDRVTVAAPRYACVGSFCIGGRFGGCYSRLDGLITTGRATYVPTFVASRGARRRSGGAA